MPITQENAREFLDAAMDAERGKRWPFESVREARQARLQCYRLRQKERDLMAKITGGEGESIYDTLTLTIEETEDGGGATLIAAKSVSQEHLFEDL